MNSDKKVLHLNLKKKWYDMILSGEKKEEYRGVKDYWAKRFNYFNSKDLITCNHGFSEIVFRNGYSKNAPTMKIQLKSIELNTGKPEWGANPKETYFVIKLGEIIK